jgi:hypothetical protein
MRVRVRLSLYSIVACLACSERVSARLEVEPDTLALYGRDYSWVTVTLVDAAGVSEAHGARLTARDTSIVRTSGTSLACLREGTTPVDVQVERLATTFLAHCEFAARLDVEPHLILETGGTPHSLAATAVFSSGISKILPPISARVNDTTVAVVRDGSVVPLAIGYAGLRIDYGGLWSRMGIDVRRTIANDTVTVATGGTRNWALDPGRYTITVRVKSPRDLNILNMETTGLRCSRDSRDGDLIHCVADEPAQVMFHNTSSGGTARTGQAFIRIVQIR